MAASANEMDNRQMPSSIDLNKLIFIFIYVVADDTKAISMNESDSTGILSAGTSYRHRFHGQRPGTGILEIGHHL
jgi:hypothetical protein